MNSVSPCRTRYEPLLAGRHQPPYPWTNRDPFSESDPQRTAPLCRKEIKGKTAFGSPAIVSVPDIGFGAA